MIIRSSLTSRVVIAALALVLGLTINPAKPLAKSNGNPGVIPPQARPHGLTYGEWGAKWWQWVFSIPAPLNPNLDATGANCGQGQSGSVWFLAGNFGGISNRTCEVPPGKALFFPILNTAFGAGVFDCEPSVPGVACNIDALRASAAAQIDDPLLLEVSIDGIPLQNLTAYRAQSPVFSVTFPIDAVFGIPSGTFTPHVADGYWLMLAPLSRGRHTIHSIGINNSGFAVDVMTNLIVKDK